MKETINITTVILVDTISAASKIVNAKAGKWHFKCSVVYELNYRHEM